MTGDHLSNLAPAPRPPDFPDVQSSFSKDKVPVSDACAAATIGFGTTPTLRDAGTGKDAGSCYWWYPSFLCISPCLSMMLPLLLLLPL